MFVPPVWVSTTRMVTSTLVRPPANTQNLLFTAQASRTLTTTSTLALLKNQRYPVSVVSGTTWALPEAPVFVCQVAVTMKRPFSRQRVWLSAVQVLELGVLPVRFQVTPPRPRVSVKTPFMVGEKLESKTRR